MNKLIEVKFGSHLYGTDTEKSDLDLKVLYLPSAREICLGSWQKVFRVGRTKESGERNTAEDTDVEVFSLDRFLEDLMDGQTWALDMLFAPPESYTYASPEGLFLMNEILHFKDRLLTKNINAFVGYAKKQAAKYGIKGTRFDAIKRTVDLLKSLPTWDRLWEHREALNALAWNCNTLLTAEQTPLVEILPLEQVSGEMLDHLHVCGRKMALTATVGKALECYGKIEAEYGARARKASLAGGIDWKALSHAVRVNTEALELLQTGVVTFPRPDRELLLRIKTNEENPTLTYDEVATMIEEGLVALDKASKVSSLREIADKKWAENLIVREHRRIVTRDEQGRDHIAELETRIDELQEERRDQAKGHQADARCWQAERTQLTDRADCVRLQFDSAMNALGEEAVRVRELEQEVYILRLWGNKDCTAQADEQLKLARKTTRQEPIQEVYYCAYHPGVTRPVGEPCPACALEKEDHSDE